METVSVSFKIGNEEIKLETGKLAKQANGSVLATQGGTVVLSAVTASKKPTTMDYFPLQVAYNEKFYAAGKIPGGFIKREGRPKDQEILTSRMIDRPMRPLFPKGFMNEVQVVPTTISFDHVNPPDILAMIAAAASVSISDIPFGGPVGSCRVGMIDDQFIINPSFEEIEKSDLDLIVSGSADAILMVEGHANFISEEKFLEGLKAAHEAIKIVVAAVNEFVEKAGKPKMEFTAILIDDALEKEVRKFSYEKLSKANKNPEKMARYEAVGEVMTESLGHFSGNGKSEDEMVQVDKVLHNLEKEAVRREILEDSIRPDGRKLDEIRKITCEVSALPRTHGSSIFTRGQTQALVVTTLGNARDAKRMDNLEGDSEKKFMMHYNFPPFSVGETGRFGSPGRREIGHGMLAERALTSILPDPSDFPYTIRLVSEILESNGSSSMASVCGGCLALMDAGVPVKDTVAGIAMGLIMDSADSFKILTDIQGLEDHLGDMDFKVTGTKKGITAFQMDIKVQGITFDIFGKAIEQAKAGRLFIIDKMEEVMAKPRPDISQYAPKIVTIKIKEDQIGSIIGKGGETIKRIQEETGTSISIEDNGQVSIAGVDSEGAEKALEIIRGITTEIEVGTEYNGTVRKVVDFGAFIELVPGKDGLCHISKLAEKRVEKASDVVSEGDKIKVKVIEIDKLGRINLKTIQ
ncbi:MAG: polyribonucleotide nucleotidyltransferase [Spirochaetes bacterium]|nr:polyribonucleotide nucleotidyltransferase [Spirochaetota bacterium]